MSPSERASRRSWFSHLAFAALGSLYASPSADERTDGEGQEVTVAFEESDELIANPGMGWQTFHQFVHEDPHLDGLPSSVAYFRFPWSELEPRDGAFNHELFDRLLEKAKEAGQTLAFRIMTCGTSPSQPSYSPRWLEEKGVPFRSYKYNGSGPFYTPDLDNPKALDYHLRLIHHFGERYDRHPQVDLVDIGSVGLWGEWHMSGTGLPMPSPETCQKIIDAHLTAFPTRPKVMLIGGDRVVLPLEKNALQYAVEKGAGWRADCLGDMGGFSKTWNHMRDYYPHAVAKGKAQDAWKRSPVAFESCWDIRKWVQEGWDLPFIFDYALNFHASYMNNKSAPIPSVARPEVERFLKRLGYRIVLRKAQFPNRIVRRLTVRLLFENVGVAPPYRDDRIVLGLTNNRQRVPLPTKESIRGWEPGSRKVQVSVTLPPLPSDTYLLSLSIADPLSHRPVVRLANKGVERDFWLPLGSVQVGEG